MEKILYLECASGISGDMTVGSLLDLGADAGRLEAELKKLPVEGYTLHFGRKNVRGLDAFDFDVFLEHPEEPCRGQEHGHGEHGHGEHGHPHPHHSGEEHSHAHGHSHGHSHRTMREIREILENSELSEKVKELSIRIFTVLAQAEGKVHGKPPEEVGFHEVGAVDSIVDIVGTAVCLENLGIDRIVYSRISEGRGHVWCQHGLMPVPVPAVLELAAQYGLPLTLTDTEGEMVTPTGAAILAALAVREEDPLRGRRIAGIGLGAGNREYKQANVLRALLLEGESPRTEQTESVWVLETNVDDASGEELGYCIEKFLKAGARDACCIPLWMKKHRPAYLLQVICDEEHREELENILFRETTSIGFRRYRQERRVLERESRVLESSLGPVRIKCCRHLDQVFAYPEYEDAARIAEKTGMPFREVMDRLREEAAEKVACRAEI